MRYRRDVDGLRALAVVPVVLFHAGVTGFSGGFVGVDIFFVISGFLITSLIAEEVRAGRFSIFSFYERRARRILPALFAVIAISTALAIWLLLPSELSAFGSSVVATLAFASNVLFWHQSGYFDAPALEKPLLHTWSLAVEEQFYVFFPLLLLAIHRWLGGRWSGWLAPIAVLSFAASVWGAVYHPSATFYLAPTRAWELLLGALLALEAFPQLTARPIAELAALAGLALIAWGVFGLTAQSTYPGLNALYPCLGAALVMHSGAASPTMVRRLLGMPPLVFVGLISYSLYLWHWPLLVFAPLWKFGSLAGAETAGIIAASFAAAVISWRFVEAPFRQRGGLLGRRQLFTAAAAASICLAGVGLFARVTNGWPQRFAFDVAAIAATRAGNARFDQCTDRPSKRIPIAEACAYGADVPPAFAVWGDSHAGAMIDTLGSMAAAHGTAIRFFSSSGCAPQIGMERELPENPCRDRNQATLDAILADAKLTTIILIGRYSAYIEGLAHELGPAEAQDFTDTFLGDADGGHLETNEREALFARQMQALVATLTKAGRRVVLVYPVPEVGYDVPPTLARLTRDRGDPARFTRPRRLYDERQRAVFAALDGAGSSPLVIRIYPHKRLCDQVRCIVFADGKVLYHDDDHLSLAGADYVAPIYETLFDQKPSEAAVAAGSHP